MNIKRRIIVNFIANVKIMLKNRIVFIFLFLQFFDLHSQEINNLSVPKLTQKGFAEMSYLSVKMPSDEENLSLVGINFNLYLMIGLMLAWECMELLEVKGEACLC